MIRRNSATGQRSPATVPAVGELVLRIQGLTKRFGALTAVDHLSLDVYRGEVVGLLGPNGAGKSTTVGMILDLIRPTAGCIQILGRDVVGHQAMERREVGAIIEQPSFYPYLSGRDNLRAIGLTVGRVEDDRIEQLLALVGLMERANSRFRTYSLGMKQRLGIASTLLTDPALIILDEPTNGLDPAGQREVRELIPSLAQEGHSVLLASHLLHEVEQVCGRVAIIRQGKLLASGLVSDLLHSESFLQIDVNNPVAAAEIVRGLPFVSEVKVEDGTLSIGASPEHGSDINRALAGQGLYASAIVPRTSSLEDIFFELTEGPETPERSADHGPAAAR